MVSFLDDLQPGADLRDLGIDEDPGLWAGFVGIPATAEELAAIDASPMPSVWEVDALPIPAFEEAFGPLEAAQEVVPDFWQSYGAGEEAFIGGIDLPAQETPEERLARSEAVLASIPFPVPSPVPVLPVQSPVPLLPVPSPVPVTASVPIDSVRVIQPVRVGAVKEGPMVMPGMIGEVLSSAVRRARGAGAASGGGGPTPAPGTDLRDLVIGTATDVLSSAVRRRGGREILPREVGMGMITPDMVVKTWTTSHQLGPARGGGMVTTRWAKLADGRLLVERADGTVKLFRPKKHLVISSNPRTRQLVTAARRLDRLTAGLTRARPKAAAAAQRVKGMPGRRPKRKRAAK